MVDVAKEEQPRNYYAYPVSDELMGTGWASASDLIRLDGGVTNLGGKRVRSASEEAVSFYIRRSIVAVKYVFSFQPRSSVFI